MKFKATISGAFLIIATYSSAQVVHTDSATFSAFLAKKIINNRDDMLLTAIVTSEKGRIVVPDEDIWGYVPSEDGFIAIQVQKKLKAQFVDFPMEANLSADLVHHMDTLNIKQKKPWSLNIAPLFDFNQGEYRVRVLSRLSLYNSLPDLYSSWFYFSCSKRIDPY